MRDYWYDFVTSLWRNIREVNLFLLNIKVQNFYVHHNISSIKGVMTENIQDFNPSCNLL